MKAIEILALDHVVIRVANLEQSLAFYRDGLGCAVERRIDSLGLIQLRAGASLIDLVPIDSPLGQAGGPAPPDAAVLVVSVYFCASLFMTRTRLVVCCCQCKALTNRGRS